MYIYIYIYYIYIIHIYTLYTYTYNAKLTDKKYYLFRNSEINVAYATIFSCKQHETEF